MEPIHVNEIERLLSTAHETVSRRGTFASRRRHLTIDGLDYVLTHGKDRDILRIYEHRWCTCRLVCRAELSWDARWRLVYFKAGDWTHEVARQVGPIETLGGICVIAKSLCAA